MALEALHITVVPLRLVISSGRWCDVACGKYRSENSFLLKASLKLRDVSVDLSRCFPHHLCLLPKSILILLGISTSVTGADLIRKEFQAPTAHYKSPGTHELSVQRWVLSPKTES